MATEQKRRELTVSAAVAKIRKLNEEQIRAYKRAAAGVDGKYDAKRMNVLECVHPSARAAVLEEAKGNDVPPMTAAEIDEALTETVEVATVTFAVDSDDDAIPDLSAVPERLRHELDDKRLSLGRGHR